MDKRWITTACTLDCWDSCSIKAQVEENQLVKIEGNPENAVTGGFLCNKGYKHLEMRSHKNRLTSPLVRRGGVLRKASWDTALDLVGEKMSRLRQDYPTTALLYISEYGSTGVLKKADQRMFNAYGGVTMPRGSICAGAGIEAQTYDFGKTLAHEPADYLNSNMIILWGRNPVVTGPHLMPFIKGARDKGGRIVTIDPLCSETAKFSDLHIRPKPGSDGALALYMIKILLEEGLADMEHIEKHTFGFESLREYVLTLSDSNITEITGLDIETIRDLALEYGRTKPAAIIMGFGIQRYTNGGDTVRAVDALGAVSGNIGRSGGGVSYNHRVSEGLIDEDLLLGENLAIHRRTYKRPTLGEFILSEKNPPVRMIYTARSNPLNQGMDIGKLKRAFDSVDFKVTLDMFLTDTAAASDVVLPVSHFLEEVNLVMPPANHSYVNYCNKVVQPPSGVMSDIDIITELAIRLDLGSFPIMSGERWLEEIMSPMKEVLDVSLLKRKPLKVPGADGVPWESGRYMTRSGKFEFHSDKAKEEGFRPSARIKALEVAPDSKYPFHLLTPKQRDSLHSQHFAIIEDHLILVHMNDEKAQEMKFAEGDKVKVTTSVGSVEGVLKFDEGLLPDRIKIHQGGWVGKDAGINRVIPERFSEMGIHSAFYEVVCRVEKLLC